MSTQASNEIELLRASIQGDTSAFERIVERYQAFVCAVTYSATGDVQKSEELAQQTFISAWKNLHQLRDPARFRGWLCAVTRNIIRNSFRREKRDIISKAASLERSEIAPISHSEQDHGPVTAEHQAVVRQALCHIPEKYREPLVLFYRQEKSTKEVAQQLQLSEDAVRQRLSRGRKLLKTHLASMVEDIITRTRPGKAFTTAVVASIAGLAAKQATAAAATGTSTSKGGSAGAVTAGGILAGSAAKIAVTAAVIAIGVGAAIAYKHMTRPQNGPETFGAVAIAAKQGKDSIGRYPERPGDAAEENPRMDKAQDGRQVAESFVLSDDSVTSGYAEYKFEPKGVLSGLITDAETAEPIADTQIRISCERIYEARTNMNGFYSFDKIDRNENYEMSINSWDHVGIDFNADRPPTIRLENGKQVVRHFQLNKACMIELRVVDANGAPVKHADVHVSRMADSRGWSVGAEETGGVGNKTDDNGFVLLGGLPPKDTYFITIRHSCLVRTPENSVTYRYDYAPSGLEVFLDDPGSIELIEVVLQRGQTVRGYAQYQDGEPAEDITIVPVPEWWHSNHSTPSFEVDANGFFTLENIVAQNYNIGARVPQGDGWSQRKILEVQLPPQDAQVLNITIPSKSPKNLASISGSIKWIGEKRPGYLDIGVYSASLGHHTINIWNFENETFKIDRLEPGNYELRAEGDILEPLTIKNVRAPAEALVLELTCSEKPALRGVVLDATTQKPLSKFQVRLRKIDTLRGPHWTQTDQWFAFEGRDGSFEVQAVGPGIYDIQAKAEGYAPAWSERISTDENRKVSICLSAGGASISGSVLDKDGKPVAGATVMPLSKACGMGPITKYVFVTQEASVKTNDAGEFLLTQLPEGLETLKVTHPDYGFIIKPDVEVKTAVCTENVTITLPKGGIVDGTVYDEHGTPQAGVVIRAQDKAGWCTSSDDPSILATATTEPNGFYRMTALPEDMVYLMRKDEWDSLGVVRRAIAPKNGTRSCIDFGGTNIVAGQIILNGEPLAEQKVIISSPRDWFYPFFKAVAKTDAEGRFVFRGIIPGHYGIFYEMNRNRSYWLRLTECEIGPGDQDLGIIPQAYCNLYLAIQQPPRGSWDISNVHIQYEGQNMGTYFQYEKAGDPNKPGKVGPVPPGTYFIGVYRTDGVRYNQEIEVSEDAGQDVKKIIVLPEGNSTVYGTISRDIMAVLLKSTDESIGALIRGDNNGGYEVSNLPAGGYRFEDYSLQKDNAFTFSLEPGQDMEINLDRSLFGNAVPGALLTVSIVSETGAPHEASAGLSANGTTIEPMHDTGCQKIFLAPAGDYLLNVSCQGCQDIRKPVTVRPTAPGEMPQMKPQQVLVRLKPADAN